MEVRKVFKSFPFLIRKSEETFQQYLTMLLVSEDVGLCLYIQMTNIKYKMMISWPCNQRWFLARLIDSKCEGYKTHGIKISSLLTAITSLGGKRLRIALAVDILCLQQFRVSQSRKLLETYLFPRLRELRARKKSRSQVQATKTKHDDRPCASHSHT